MDATIYPYIERFYEKLTERNDFQLDLDWLKQVLFKVPLRQMMRVDTVISTTDRMQRCGFLWRRSQYQGIE